MASNNDNNNHNHSYHHNNHDDDDEHEITMHDNGSDENRDGRLSGIDKMTLPTGS